MATAKSTKQTTEEKLAIALKDLGQTKKTFTTARTAYDRLTSDKRVKSDITDKLAIGSFICDCKEKAKGSNLNSGVFGDFVKTYFPRLSPQDISGFQWLFNNQTEAISFNTSQKKPTANVESLKQSIRKALGAKENTTAADYEKYGLKTPLASKKKVEQQGKDEEKVISRKSLESMDIAELCGWSSALVNKLDSRSKNNSAMFDKAAIADIERLSLQLADIHEHITSKQKQTAAKVIKDENKKVVNG